MNRLTNVGSNGEIWITDNDETRHYGRKESAYKKLAKYEDLEDRLNGISIQQVVDGFVKTIENQTNEGYEHGRILTNEEANQWNEYRQLDEQGLLLRLPCKPGDMVYSIANDGKIYPVKATREVRIVNGVLHIICESCRYSDLVSYDDIGKTVFLTQAEAEQKLNEIKEKEEENYPER